MVPKINVEIMKTIDGRELQKKKKKRKKEKQTMTEWSKGNRSYSERIIVK